MTARRLWESDAIVANGPTSLSMLLAWLQTPGNYVRWKSKKRETGISKEKLCKEIETTMHARGLTHRSTRDIRNKMTEFERGMRRVIIWQTKRGLPVLELLNVRTDDEILMTITKKCRYFVEIAPVMLPVINRLMETGSVASLLNGDDDDDSDSEGNASSRRPAGYEIGALAKRQRLAKVLLDEIEEGKLQLEKSKLQLEATQLAADEERLRTEMERQRIDLVKEKALARQELRNAGVPEDEIDKAFPLS